MQITFNLNVTWKLIKYVHVHFAILISSLFNARFKSIQGVFDEKRAQDNKLEGALVCLDTTESELLHKQR